MKHIVHPRACVDPYYCHSKRFPSRSQVPKGIHSTTAAAGSTNKQRHSSIFQSSPTPTLSSSRLVPLCAFIKPEDFTLNEMYCLENTEMPARVIGTTTMPDFATELLNGDFDQEDLEDHDLSDGFNKGDSDGDEGSYEDQDDSGNNSNHWASFAPSRTYAHGRETDPAPSEQYQTFSATSSYVNSGSSGGVDNDWIFATVPTPAKSVSTAFTATPVATTPSSEAVEREARRRRFERHASRGLQDEASSSSPEALSALKRKRRRKGKDLQRYVLLKNAQLLD